MLKNDTIDKGPSKLLLKQIDLENYYKHRRNVSEIQSLTKLGNGTHIKHISRGKQDQLEEEKNTEIEKANHILFQKIRKIMERKPYKVTTHYPLRQSSRSVVPQDRPRDLMAISPP